jgi:nucleoside phosphorylase
MRVLILTPLKLERDAFIPFLPGEWKPVFKGTALYEQVEFKGKFHDYTVYLCQPGMYTTNMALATSEAVHNLNPELIILSGVAGGVKDVEVGDLIIPDKIYYYQAGKESSEGYHSRPQSYYPSGELLARAKHLTYSGNWKNRLSNGVSEAKTLIAPLAAGDNVIGTRGELYKIIRSHFNDTAAIDMESSGLFNAVHQKRTIHALAVRGISDLLEGKTDSDAKGSQPIAGERAAAFVMELLWELDCSSFIIQNMDSKTLAKAIFKILFPLPASFKEIGNDFANAANNEVREIWKRVKPLFIQEVKELAKDPDDSAMKGMAEVTLRTALERDEVLRKELITLHDLIEKQSVGGSITVSGAIEGNSGPVVIGSGNNTQIHSGDGDNIGGDKIINNSLA